MIRSIALIAAISISLPSIAAKRIEVSTAANNNYVAAVEEVCISGRKFMTTTVSLKGGAILSASTAQVLVLKETKHGYGTSTSLSHVTCPY